MSSPKTTILSEYPLSSIVSPTLIKAKTTIAKLKRTIELEYHELYSVNMLISIIEDAEGFVLSNNSVVGDHLKHGDTVYVQSHK